MAMGYYFVGSRHISPEGGDLPEPDRPPRRDGDMLGQLTAREDGGIDHGESRQLRTRKTSVDLPAAAARERNKINSTGGLE
jgi:hypothetical protein